MVNKNRGEVAIKIANKKYIMRPTFHALCSIENEINKSIIDVLLQFSESKPKLLDIQAIIYHGIVAYGNSDVNRDDLGADIYESGIVNIMPAVLEFLEISLGITTSSN
jgi:hypothetical protein